MKTLFLPLLAASPIFFALAPLADAAAITFDTGALRPRLLGPGSFYQRNRFGVPGSVFRTPQAKVSSAINDALNLSGGTIKTGSGTPTLDNSGFVSGGILTVGGGTVNSGTVNLVGGTISAGSWTSVRSGTIQIDWNSSNVRVAAVNLFVGGETTSSDGLSGSSIKTGTGTLTLEGSLGGHFVGGTSDFGAGQTLDSLVIDSGATVTLDTLSSPPAAPVAATAATSPVPEPASAVLLLIGALAVSQSRRGRES